MLVVKLELWPGGDESQARPMGRVEIWNDGTGDQETSNYEATAAHAGIYYGQRTEPFKRGYVKGFKRMLSPYRLLYRVLRSMQET